VRLDVITRFILIILGICILCSCSRQYGKPPTEKEAVNKVKSYLFNKYGKEDFSVKVKQFKEAKYNEAGLNSSWSYLLEAKDNKDTYNVTFSYYGINENIEKRDWNKESNYYYKDKLHKINQNTELVNIEVDMKKSPSRMGMSFEEYLNESKSPYLNMEYTIFVDESPTNITQYDSKIKQIYLTLNPQKHYYYMHKVNIADKKYKTEYLKKAKEILKLEEDCFRFKIISLETYRKENQILEDWFKAHVFDSATIGWCTQIYDEENNPGVHWGRTKHPT